MSDEMKIGKFRWAVGSILLGGALVAGVAGLATGSGQAFGDDDGDEGRKQRKAFVADAVYQKECGSCHLAYPPNLLPQESWRRVMAGLEDHFGENAALDAATSMHISSYLAGGDKPKTAGKAAVVPVANWSDIMQKLEGHVGKNGKVDAEGAKIIARYLDQPIPVEQAGNLEKMLPDASLRITEQPRFLRKHDEVPKKMVAGNPKVGSFSQCDRCHADAAKGDFNEHRVDIPGFGRWND